MKLRHHLEGGPLHDGPVVLALGMFDGVHRGHAALLEAARREAERLGGEAWVLTFTDHPRRILAPGQAPTLLTSPGRKMELLDAHGIHGCLLLDFSEALSVVEPEDFLDALPRQLGDLRCLIVGSNWRFGHRARGDAALLRDRGERLGIEIRIPDAVTWDGDLISSTRIRGAIAEGDIEAAAAMLGRHPDYRGPVVHGAKRGRKLGFPTANLDLPDVLIPPPGIYAGWAILREIRHGAAIYLPRLPAEHRAAVEVHLLDLEQDLYGQNLQIEFFRRMRDDNQRFDREGDLIDRIRRDVDDIRMVLHEASRHG